MRRREDGALKGRRYNGATAEKKQDGALKGRRYNGATAEKKQDGALKDAATTALRQRKSKMAP